MEVEFEKETPDGLLTAVIDIDMEYRRQRGGFYDLIDVDYAAIKASLNDEPITNGEFYSIAGNLDQWAFEKAREEIGSWA